MFRQLTIPSLLKEGKKTAVLAVPLVIGQVSQMLMIVADTVMVGNVGVTELAALSFANAVFAIPFVFGIGPFYAFFAAFWQLHIWQRVN